MYFFEMFVFHILMKMVQLGSCGRRVFQSAEPLAEQIFGEVWSIHTILRIRALDLSVKLASVKY